MEPWQAGKAPSGATWGSDDEPCRSYQARLELRRADRSYQGAICLCRGPLASAQELARGLLSDQELRYFGGLVLERRKHSYLLGRFAAKRAVSLLTGQPAPEISIGYGVFHNPMVSAPAGATVLEVSITHCCGRGAALAFPAAHPMGIDLERIEAAKMAVIEETLTAGEKKLLRLVPGADYASILVVVWTVKEAIAKALRTGLMTPLSVYEISKLERIGPVYISYFRYFAQYKAVSLLLDDGHVCSICSPRKTELELDLPGMLSRLS